MARKPRCEAMLPMKLESNTLLHSTLMLSLAALLPTFGIAADNAPRADDFAQGIEIMPTSDSPLVEITLPDAVYRTVVSQELKDIAVFNGSKEPVPFALCVMPKVLPSTSSSTSLPVFELQAAKTTSGNEARIDLSTPSGTSMRIEASPTEGVSSSQPRAHVIDARVSEAPLRSIQFAWSSPDGASEARVRLEASDDLDRWVTLIPTTTLLQVAADGQELRRERIELPTRAYQYLRIVRIDGGPTLAIHSAIGESVSAERNTEPLWISAELQGSKDNAEWFYDAQRIAPVSYAKVVLASGNASVKVRIESRANNESEWRSRWSGEVYSIVTDGQRRTSKPAQFVPVTERYWRIVKDARAVAPSGSLALELGFHPARVQFLASGDAPYMLAFGSRRAAATPAYACNGLIGDTSTLSDGTPPEGLIGDAYLGELRTLGGDLALQAPPVPTPVKRIVLWAVLVLGAASLIAMAVTVLKKVRADGD